MRNELSGGLLAADQRLQTLRNQYDKLVTDVEKCKKDNTEAVTYQLEAIISCKSGLQALVVANESLNTREADLLYDTLQTNNTSSQACRRSRQKLPHSEEASH